LDDVEAKRLIDDEELTDILDREFGALVEK